MPRTKLHQFSIIFTSQADSMTLSIEINDHVTGYLRRRMNHFQAFCHILFRTRKLHGREPNAENSEDSHPQKNRFCFNQFNQESKSLLFGSLIRDPSICLKAVSAETSDEMQRGKRRSFDRQHCVFNCVSSIHCRVVCSSNQRKSNLCQRKNPKFRFSVTQNVSDGRIGSEMTKTHSP